MSIPYPEGSAEADFLAWRGRRIAAGMAEKAARGEPTGPVPLGYRKVRDHAGAVHVEIDEAVAPLVREAFRLAAEGASIRGMLPVLTDMGLVSRHGKPLSPTALWRILRNHFYAGFSTCNGEVVQGMQPAIVSEELFQAVQEAQKGNGAMAGEPLSPLAPG